MNQRPINLNLLTIQFPLPAIVSILHRISGIVLCLMIPFVLWMLKTSLHSEAEFNDLSTELKQPFFLLLMFILLAALLFHTIAGIRHLLMDIHIGDSLRGGRISAVLVLILFVLGVLGALGAGLWWR